MNTSHKPGANDTLQRMLVQQRMAMRYFLTIFIPVFLVSTIDDLVHRNTVEFFANAAMTVILLSILITRRIPLNPRREHRVTSIFTLVFVFLLGGITFYMIAFEGEVNRFPWAFLFVVLAIYTLETPLGIAIGVVFVGVMGYLAVYSFPVSLSGQELMGLKIRYISALALSLLLAIVIRRVVAALIRKQCEVEIAQQELNHRVKNNLAIVSSLIRLKESESPTVLDLSDLRNRIDAIMLVHERLQYSEQFSEISTRAYFRDVLVNTTAGYPGGVAIRGTIEEFQIPTRTAVPIGLILTELATNAIKYGFVSGEPAEISLDLAREDSRVKLVFSNTGNPLTPDTDIDEPATLGLQLVTMLVDQIGGTVDLRCTPQPEFSIEFPG